jgi:hypothetical protein
MRITVSASTYSTGPPMAVRLLLLVGAAALAAAWQPPPSPPPNGSAQWEIVSAAVLKGSAFKQRSIAWLASSNVAEWQECQRLCAGNSSCTAFDHVGANLKEEEDDDEEEEQEEAEARGRGIKEGDCWYRLDGLWELSPNHNRNHTSGRLVTPPPPVPVAPKGSKNVLFIIFVTAPPLPPPGGPSPAPPAGQC